jgi:hypothetical protein
MPWRSWRGVEAVRPQSMISLWSYVSLKRYCGLPHHRYRHKPAGCEARGRCVRLHLQFRCKSSKCAAAHAHCAGSIAEATDRHAHTWHNAIRIVREHTTHHITGLRECVRVCVDNQTLGQHGHVEVCLFMLSTHRKRHNKLRKEREKERKEGKVTINRHNSANRELTSSLTNSTSYDLRASLTYTPCHNTSLHTHIQLEASTPHLAVFLVVHPLTRKHSTSARHTYCNERQSK